MRLRLPEIAIARPITVLMLTITCIGAGFIVSQRIAVEFLPPMDLPFLGAFVPYPGASPKQVEQQIAIPAEGEFRTISNLERIRTNSTDNGCFVGMRFAWGTNMDDALAEVRDRMERLRLELPDDVDRIYVRHFSLETIPIMQLGLASDMDHGVFQQIVRDDIVPLISRLEGVAEVQVFGADEETAVVGLDQQSMVSSNLSIYEVVGRLQTASVDTGVGEITDGDRKMQVRTKSELRTVEDYANLQIRPGLRLQDFASGEMRSRDREYRFSIDGKDEVFLVITKESEANSAATCERVIVEIERILAESEWEGAHYFTFFNQGDVITGALGGLAKASAFGGLMALVVLYLFLRRIRPTITVGLAIPASLVVGLVITYALGISLNLVTMMSFIVAVGMVVDNAIVVIENIYRHRQLGSDPVSAARDGASEVALAIVAATSTTAVVFLPVFYLQSGQMSVFTRQFAVPVTMSLAASLIIALTVIPLAASRFKAYDDSWLEKRRREKQVDGDKPSAVSRRIQDVYANTLNWVLRQRLASFAILGALVMLTAAWPMKQVGFQSLPGADRRYVEIDVRFQPNYDIEKAENFFDAMQVQLNERREELGIKHLFTNYTSRGGELTLYLLQEDDLGPGEDWPYSSEEVMNILWKIFPGEFPGGRMSFETGESSSGRDTMRRNVRLRMEGQDADEIDKHSERLIAQLELMPNVHEAKTQTRRSDPEIQIRMDPELTGQLGVDPTVAAQTVAFAMRGTKLSTLKQGTRETEIWAEFEEMDRAGVGNLQNIQVQTDDMPAALHEFATLSRSTTPQEINRLNGKIYVDINASVSGGDLRETRESLRAMVSGFELPTGYRVMMGDEFRNMDEDQQSFQSILLLAVILIYVVMAALFESYVLPLSVLMTVPLAFLGVYWGMFATGTSMDTVAFIGCVLMVGVVVNNGIVIVDRINQLRDSGMARTDAILQGGRDRLRPVVMTALTTVLGAIPLAIGGRIGEPAAVSLGRAMIGGLVGGTVLTLVVVPLFYSVIDDFRNWSLRFLADIRALAFPKRTVSR